MPLRCHGWGCKRCRVELVQGWLSRLVSRDFRPTGFLTVTVDPAALVASGIGLEDWDGQRLWWLRRLRVLWQSARRWAKTRGLVFRYWRTFETHRGLVDQVRGCRNFRMHVHALIEAGPSGGGVKDVDYSEANDWWFAKCQALGIGRACCYNFPVDDAQRLGRYVTKYATKETLAGLTRCRKVAASRTLAPAWVNRHSVVIQPCLVRVPVERGGSGAIVVMPTTAMLRAGHSVAGQFYAGSAVVERADNGSLSVHLGTPPRSGWVRPEVWPSYNIRLASSAKGVPWDLEYDPEKEHERRKQRGCWWWQ